MKTMLNILPIIDFFVQLKKRGILVLLIIIMSPVPACAANNKQIEPSFNWAKISDGVEKIICDSEELSQLDVVLSKVYKTSREIYPNIKQEQREWLKKRNSCREERGESQQSCLKHSYFSRIQALRLISERGIQLPVGWEDFVQSKWLKILNKECPLKENMKHIRFVNHRKLDKNSELLTIACSIGAYLDSQLVYLLTKHSNAVYAKQIVFLRPVYQDGWKVFLSDKLTGGITLRENNQVLSVFMHSGGGGTCGYIVNYNVSDLYNSKPLKPVRLKAEYDCDKGIVFDNWPNIPLPLSLGIRQEDW